MKERHRLAKRAIAKVPFEAKMSCRNLLQDFGTVFPDEQRRAVEAFLGRLEGARMC